MKKIVCTLLAVLLLLSGCVHSEPTNPTELPKQYYTMEDFQSIVIGESTMGDVCEITPGHPIMYVASYGGFFEFPMENGEYIQVKFYGEELIVGAIEITEQSYASTTGRGEILN